jgi:hypothetical protein
VVQVGGGQHCNDLNQMTFAYQVAAQFVDVRATKLLCLLKGRRQCFVGNSTGEKAEKALMPSSRNQAPPFRII